MKMRMVRKKMANGRVSLGLDGEFSIYIVKELRNVLVKEIAQSPDLELNLAAVNEMDTAGFQLLVYLKREAARRGGKLVVGEASEVVRSLLSMYGAQFA